MTLPSAICPPKRKPAPKRRRIRRTTLTGAVRKVFQYMDGKWPKGMVGVFFINGDVRMADASKSFFKAWQEKHPDALVGIYDRHLSVENLISDLKEFIK